MARIEPPPVDKDILDRARAEEPERYIAALLASSSVRTDLLALTAFTADLVRIPKSVTEPMMGEIRLQWWRDQFVPLAEGKKTSHPVADALGLVIRRHGLPLPLLTAMTEARAFDLYADPLPDDAALEGYLTKTESIPFELALRVTGVDDATAGRIAAPAGRAFGLARLALTLPEFWATGRSVLPDAWFTAAATSAEQQLTRSDTAGASRLVDTLLAAATTARAAVEPQSGLLSRRQRAALLPLAATPRFASLARAQATGGMREKHEMAPLRRIAGLVFAHLRGRL